MKFNGVTLAIAVVLALIIYFTVSLILKVRKYNEDYFEGYLHAFNMDALCLEDSCKLKVVKDRYLSDKAFDVGFRAYFNEDEG